MTAVKIGPVRIDGDRRKVSVALGANPPERREVRWFETDVYPGLEAAGGPFALPQDIVRYRLRPTREGEVTSTLPLAGKSHWWIATTPVKIGGRTAFVGFAPQFENTVTSAALGALIAREGNGSFSGTSDPVTISHGVKRPVRTVALAKPFRLGSVSLNSILVRTTDYGNTDEIPDLQEMAEDPEQIVVQGRAKRRTPLYLGYIGQDYLKHCSWIEFDKARKTITLSCIAS
ncbi:MAG: hypothetical protein K5821_06920 [Nitrobacter sp.]|uniref:hypothetical protein n=1 Tax=Nitrobacter sp. TaxID=29420 RepID=UPI00262A29AA|nr:hypothetical protein [Nitrobacter sp.]MCV0386150.1 hypothetical protein [Nitrobacter sp.]